jgi:peptide deformylase
MLKTNFVKQLDFDLYIIEQKLRKEKGYLTVSERKQLDELIKNSKNYIVPEEPKKEYKKIITDINALKVYCLEVKKDEDIKHIIKDLQETLTQVNGLGLSANQIGYNRQICYIRIPIYNPKEKKTDLKDLILINPKIIEKSNPIKIKNESCLSFPGIDVITKRYVYCTITYLDEHLKENTMMLQDLEAFTVQHEIDHLNGKTIFDRKWREL